MYQTQPELYGKVKWMATSERVNLLTIKISFKKKKPTSKKLNSTNKIIITQNSNKMH